jgi:hypothetical protein
LESSLKYGFYCFHAYDTPVSPGRNARSLS